MTLLLGDALTRKHDTLGMRDVNALDRVRTIRFGCTQRSRLAPTFSCLTLAAGSPYGHFLRERVASRCV